MTKSIWEELELATNPDQPEEKRRQAWHSIIRPGQLVRACQEALDSGEYERL